jgi:hypothetical protein
MKYLLGLALLGFSLTAKADMLRLRDGRIFTGQFLGATRTEILFKADAAGDFLGAVTYPITQVESLVFGPDLRQSRTGPLKGGKALPAKTEKKTWLGGRDSNPDTQIQSLQSYH